MTSIDLLMTACNLSDHDEAQPASVCTENDVADAPMHEPNDSQIPLDAAAEAPSEEGGAFKVHDQGGAAPGGLNRDDATMDVYGHVATISRPISTPEVVQACDRIAAIAQINTAEIRAFDNILQHFCRDRDQQIMPTEFKHRRRQLENCTQALQEEYYSLVQAVSNNFRTYGPRDHPSIYIPCEAMKTALDAVDDAVTLQYKKYWDMMASMRGARRKQRRFRRKLVRIYTIHDHESQA
jgi:hypothetical protein